MPRQLRRKVGVPTETSELNIVVAEIAQLVEQWYRKP